MRLVLSSVMVIWYPPSFGTLPPGSKSRVIWYINCNVVMAVLSKYAIHVQEFCYPAKLIASMYRLLVRCEVKLMLVCFRVGLHSLYNVLVLSCLHHRYLSFVLKLCLHTAHFQAKLLYLIVYILGRRPAA